MAKYISFFNYDHQPPYCREQIQKSPTHILFQDRAPLTAGLERILISHHFHFIPIAPPPPSPTPHKVRFDYSEEIQFPSLTSEGRLLGERIEE